MKNIKMTFLKTKKKKIIFIIILFLLSGGIYLSIIISDLVRYGYDRQSKIIETVKKVIPRHYVKKIKDNIFVISNLKAKNDTLELQLRKYEQGYEGQKFDNKRIKLNDQEYDVNFFFLPFKRLDTNLGWKAELNSLRAHYLEIYSGKLFAISGSGKIVYCDKKNLITDNLDFKNLPNNINEILKENNSTLIGIRDLFISDDKVFISMMVKNEDGVTINLYYADLNLKKINFEIFFETNEYWEKYNVFSGGRIEKFKNEKILFSIGFSRNYESPQNKDTLLGKIISIDLNTKNHELISYGHRNPQGLYYHSNEKVVINTEHGPKGGDEINFNFLNLEQDKNFGWPKASYGQAYKGEEDLFEKDTFKKSHRELGFIEPLKYYDPSIGISEIIYLEKNSFCTSKCLWTSSLRAHSIYNLNISEDFTKLSSNGRIFLKGNRIRDIEYDKDLDLVILLSENIPAIITIR